MAMVEQSMAYPESPLDQDDPAYPCKGCGEILEEGKAFELAGNRWHIDCFRCNTCGSLLDSDANLLLLGDGSLICNNCTYSCSNCGNKIEDLAILTGDQAFCANCFKCRNCKKKIENLRYARTSQGIFCMDCHEALMARRRKKTARNAAQGQKMMTNNAVHLDKSLPSLPSMAAPHDTRTPDTETPGSETHSDAPTEIPSHGRHTNETYNGPSVYQKERSPATGQKSTRDALTLPLTTYKSERHSTISQSSDVSGADEFLVPVAFDPGSVGVQVPTLGSHITAKQTEDRTGDYFARSKPIRSASQQFSNGAHSPQHDSPQPAQQETRPHVSSEYVGSGETSGVGSPDVSGSIDASPHIGNGRTRQQYAGSPGFLQRSIDSTVRSENFKLQDAPRAKRSGGSTRSSRSEVVPPRVATTITGTSTLGRDGWDTAKDTPLLSTPMAERSYASDARPRASPVASQDYNLRESSSTNSSRSNQKLVVGQLQYPPTRGDSLETSNFIQSVHRQDVSRDPSGSQMQSVLASEARSSISAPTQIDSQDMNGGKIIVNSTESSDAKSILNISPGLPYRRDESMGAPNESFVAPRPPPVPPDLAMSRKGSISTMQSEAPRTADVHNSPSLPRYSAGGEFTMEEDMARILGGDDTQNHESFLRRVSNSVRHGRSFSDKGMRLSKDRWPRSPVVNNTSAGHEISSPISASPGHRDELSWFKNELRRERQKIVEREQRIAELEAALDSTANIRQVNTELCEKRSTMVVLDTQKEIVVRELELLTEHIAAAKKSRDPLDLGKMSNSVVREFAEALQQLKDSFAPQIEESIQKRNELVDEIAGLTQMKDKSFQEFEQLSLKNAQLAELNNQLVHQIQGLYKANSTSSVENSKGAPNGLGIYSHSKDKFQISIDSGDARSAVNDNSLTSSTIAVQQEEAEPVTVLQGPHVVNIRKGQQPKKFNWKKGGQNVAKGVTKGLKGAFSSTQQSYNREMQFTETAPYGATTPQQEYVNIPRTWDSEPPRPGFGFFNQKPAPKGSGQWKSHTNDSSSALVVDPSQSLYGSDLEQRAEFENLSIPHIVTRCIEEVETRGMDVEGIYRKSGGTSQIEMVKAHFERPSSNFNLSDPDLDIHAITSGLKQYFRRLPTPLITYDVYDKLLETMECSGTQPRIDAIQKALNDLPKVHRDVLEVLIGHLDSVVEREKENLMTSMNVAVVFAPTIMRPESLARELTDTQTKNEVVQFLVENCQEVFGGAH